MRIFNSLIIVLLLLTASCGNQPTQEKQDKKETPKTSPTSKFDAATTEKIMLLLSDYYTMKDAFVKSDTVAVHSTLESLFGKARDLRTTLSADSSNDYQIIKNLDSIMLNVLAFTDNPAWNIEQQRMAFEQISNNMFTLVKTAALKNAKIYRQYCPMAFNDKGAYWLSTDEEIKNPYFGKKMLECGEVTETIE